MSENGTSPSFGVSNPFHEFTPDDKTALVVIASLLMVIIMLFGIALKLGLRWKLKVRSSYNDVDSPIVGGAILMLGQTCCVVYAANMGLGKHVKHDGVQIDVVRKAQYAATILGTVANYSAKAAICLLIKRINDHGRMQIATRVLMGIIAATFIATLFANFFRCPTPYPWVAENPTQCPQVAHIFRFDIAMNMITDILLCILSVGMVWNVEIAGSKKALVLGLFLTRILCPITTAPLFETVQHLYQDQDHDFTFWSSIPTVWMQVTLNLSILTACIPNMKYVFESLSGGMDMVVDAPYNLTHVKGDTGFQATAIETEKGGSQSGYYKKSMPDGKLKLTPWSGRHRTDIFADSTTRRSVGNAMMSRTSKKDQDYMDDGQSESVQNLHVPRDVIVIKEEVEVLREDSRSATTTLRGPSPPPSSHGRTAQRQDGTFFHAN